MNMTATYINPTNNNSFSIDEPRWRSPEGTPLLVSDLAGLNRSDIDKTQRSIWRYATSFPINIEKPISLGEGCTPLIETSYEDINCHFKLEWFSPTGSFKDRGTSVMLSLLKQQGISAVIEDSSGNGGASVAAYGAAAGMKVKIFVPASTQAAKIAQIRAYGAEVILVPGPREATEAAAIKAADEVFYASHNWHPFFLQGTKTLGYEIWEDSGFKVPDNIVIPASAGSNLLGCYIAFKELIASGEIDRMPRLFVSQPANCSPLHNLLNKNEEELAEVNFSTTVAEGTAIKQPIRLTEMANAIRETNGKTVTLSEKEIIQASLKLSRVGLYSEPTSAHAAAGMKRLIDENVIQRDEQTVVILTGTGLKSTFFYDDQFK